MDVQRPPLRPYGGREKWGEVAASAVLVACGGLAVWAVLTVVPAEVLALRVTVVYTVLALLATLARTVATAARRGLPGLHEAQLDGSPAVRVRAWPAEWWYDLVLDGGLTVLAGVLVGLGLSAGSSWLPLVVPGGLVGAWYLGRVVLTLTGRRRNEALWLTAAEVVHDTSWGRERVRRDQLTLVRASPFSRTLLLEVAGPVRRELCPRPWRRRVRTRPGWLVVDCALMGHTPDDLAGWLRAELVPDPAPGAGRPPL